MIYLQIVQIRYLYMEQGPTISVLKHVYTEIGMIDLI